MKKDTLMKLAVLSPIMGLVVFVAVVTVAYAGVQIDSGFAVFFQSGSNAFVKDSNGTLHFVYTNDGLDLEYANSSTSGQSWNTFVVDTVGSYIDPSVLVNSTDSLFIVTPEANDFSWYESNDAGGTWVNHGIIPGFDGNATHDWNTGSAIIDQNDNIHVCAVTSEWDDDPNNDYIAYTNYTVATQSWLAPTATTQFFANEAADNGYTECDIAVDTNDVVHIVATNGADLHYWNSTINYAVRKTVCSGTCGVADSDAYPSLAVDTSNNLYVSFKNSSFNDLSFAKSTNAGSNWTIKIVDDTVVTSSSIQVDSDGVIHIIYMNDSAPLTILYRRSTDGGDTFTGKLDTLNTWGGSTNFVNTLGTLFPTFNRPGVDVLEYVYFDGSNYYYDRLGQSVQAGNVNFTFTGLGNTTEQHKLIVNYTDFSNATYNFTFGAGTVEVFTNSTIIYNLGSPVYPVDRELNIRSDEVGIVNFSRQVDLNFVGVLAQNTSTKTSASQIVQYDANFTNDDSNAVNVTFSIFQQNGTLDFGNVSGSFELAANSWQTQVNSWSHDWVTETEEGVLVVDTIDGSRLQVDVNITGTHNVSFSNNNSFVNLTVLHVSTALNGSESWHPVNQEQEVFVANIVDNWTIVNYTNQPVYEAAFIGVEEGVDNSTESSVFTYTARIVVRENYTTPVNEVLYRIPKNRLTDYGSLNTLPAQVAKYNESSASVTILGEVETGFIDVLVQNGHHEGNLSLIESEYDFNFTYYTPLAGSNPTSPPPVQANDGGSKQTVFVVAGETIFVSDVNITFDVFPSPKISDFVTRGKKLGPHVITLINTADTEQTISARFGCEEISFETSPDVFQNTTDEACTWLSFVSEGNITSDTLEATIPRNGRAFLVVSGQVNSDVTKSRTVSILFENSDGFGRVLEYDLIDPADLPVVGELVKFNETKLLDFGNFEVFGVHVLIVSVLSAVAAVSFWVFKKSKRRNRERFIN